MSEQWPNEWDNLIDIESSCNDISKVTLILWFSRTIFNPLRDDDCLAQVQRSNDMS